VASKVTEVSHVCDVRLAALRGHCRIGRPMIRIYGFGHPEASGRGTTLYEQQRGV
jgi:hypothetical protein